MTPRERLLTALARRVPDRLPATTHHLMPSFLAAVGGISDREFFDRFGLDAICWTTPLERSLEEGGPGWQLEREEVPGCDFTTARPGPDPPRWSSSVPAPHRCLP